MSEKQLPRVGDVLESPLWSEPVRVLTCRQVGCYLKIEAVGTQSQRFYTRALTAEDLEQVNIRLAQSPDLSGDAERFFLAIEAHRIRNAAQFDPLLAVSVSQVDPLPHQIEAVYHVILRNPRVRFLLADDPGAGKTIMAGLLLKELKYRRLVERTLIVVPGHLKEQWLREMKERFGEAFTIVDRPVMSATWGRNIWQDQPQIIASMDFAKQEEVLGALAETHWDLIIVDEAHKMAAYRYGEKVEKTERYRLGERLARLTHFLLFLTATPHSGDPENFRLLLNLLEPDLFANVALLEEAVQNRETPLFLRRLKEDMKDLEGRPLFPPRYVFTRPYRLSDAEKRLYNAVTDYVEKSFNKALASEKRNVAFALLILQRRLASSVRAARRSLERRKKRLEELLKLGSWLAKSETIDEESLEDSPEAERLEQEEELLERLTAAETREELQQEIDKLDELIRLAREAERQEVETKLQELREVMQSRQLQSTGEKLLVFTESRETLDYLAEKLSAWGYTVVTLHGAMNLDDRIRAEQEFRESAQVMVSTEAGGEGINLQFCALMVNYDIPWNPNRLEQRMGRIHRYGQQKEVYIYNLVATDTREGKVLEALLRKLERIGNALGSDRVFDIIGEVLPGRSLKDLIVQAIANRRTLDEIVAEIDAVPDEEAVRRTQQAAMEALATRHIDLQRVLGEDRYAREHRLVPEYIQQFFLRASRVCAMEVEHRQDGLLRVPSVPYELRNQSQAFKNRFGEVHRGYHKLAFDKQTARSKEAVFVAPGHPLLEAVIDQVLRQGEPDLRHGAVFADPDGRLDGWLWFVEGEVRDGANKPAGKRLFALFQKSADHIQVVSPALLWDLKPETPAGSLDLPPDAQLVEEFALRALEEYRAEIARERKRIADIKRKYGLRSLDTLILESEAKLTEYETRRMRGEPLPDVEVQNERQRKENLIARKAELEQEIRQMTSLSLGEHTVLGVARVVPAQDLSPLQPMRSDADIEAVGMEEAMRYEREQGRIPEDVSAQSLGYDIRSTAADGSVRYIEVKARATTGDIALTPNEWFKAQRLGEEYWLYVVEYAASRPALHPIRNPAAKLKPQEVAEVVRYIISDWKTASEGRA